LLGEQVSRWLVSSLALDETLPTVLEPQQYLVFVAFEHSIAGIAGNRISYTKTFIALPPDDGEDGV
jgi:hypothetical protein